jgi:predicted outer membrane repeat protein
MKKSAAGLKCKRNLFRCALLCCLAMFSVAALAGKLYAAVIYVDGAIGSSGSGTSWSEAVKTIQEGVDAAVANDEIWVKQGVYLLTEQITIAKALSIFGGFQGTEEVREQRDWEVYATVIDGNGGTRCFSTDAAVTFDGLTIQNGSAADNGGAIHMSGIFTKKIINCRFLNNSAASGGAVYSQGSATITECIFLDNHATNSSGGAIYCSQTVTVKNSIFNSNSAEFSGGAISSSGTFINCTFFNNLAISGNYYGFYGNSIYVAGTINAAITNCIFWRDNGSTRAEIQKFGPATLSVSYCIVPGGFSGLGNLDAEPLFVDSAGGDLHLIEGSPGIDDGNNGAPSLPAQDLDGKFRILDGDADGDAIVDMGAYEWGRYIILNAPNGGETWLGWEGPHSIEWVSGDAGAEVKIEISRDSGSTWASMIEGTANDGFYDWTVMPPASRSCRMRVSAVDDPSLFDESDADFTIDLDSEPDGMPDLWEMDQFGTLDRDGDDDWDDDGLIDRGEFDYQTNPKVKDTDADGMPDGYEVNHALAGLNPLADDRYADGDQDGFCNIREYMSGTLPEDPASQPELAVIHVDLNNLSGVEEGSRMNPFNTIQEAVFYANNQAVEEIWVRQGTYFLTEPIIVDRDVWLLGGFDGSEISRDQRDWENRITAIDGQGAVTGLDIDADAILDGFTVTNGRRGVTIASSASNPSYPLIQNCAFTDNSAYDGGAISTLFTYLTLFNCRFENNHAQYRGGAIYNEVAVMTIDACSFSDNESEENAGAIYNDGSWGTNRCYLSNTAFFSNRSGWQGGAVNNASSGGFIRNCVFQLNVAESANGGGAIYNGGSGFDIVGCDFLSNSTGYGGGAINNSNSLSTIANCLFEDNHAGYVGGAIWNWQTSASSGPTIVNSIFLGNSTDGRGGAICNSWSAPTITNCTFTNNSAVESGGGLYNGGRTFLNESPVVTNSIFWGDSAAASPEIFNNSSTPTIRYCDVAGGYSGTGNINLDPQFDLTQRLSSTSPCIDRGNNAAPEIPVIDKDGKPRIIDGDNNGVANVDMGAYEYGSGFVSDVDLDGDVDGKDLIGYINGVLNVSLDVFAGEFGKCQ